MLDRVPSRHREIAIQLLQESLGLGTGWDAKRGGAGVAAALLKWDEVEAPVIFDVGANKGQFAMSVREVLAKDGVVHSFEPSRSAAEAYLQLLGDDPRFILHRHALGLNDGNAVLYADQPGSELGSMTRRDTSTHGIEHGSIEEHVTVRSLDNIMDELNLQTIDLLKIDVEGHEWDVLKGATRTFDSRRIGMVQFEFGGANVDTRTFFRDLFRFFSLHHFAICRIISAKRLYRIHRYTDRLEQFRCANYLAIHEARMDRVSQHLRLS